MFCLVYLPAFVPVLSTLFYVAGVFLHSTVPHFLRIRTACLYICLLKICLNLCLGCLCVIRGPVFWLSIFFLHVYLECLCPACASCCLYVFPVCVYCTGCLPVLVLCLRMCSSCLWALILWPPPTRRWLWNSAATSVHNLASYNVHCHKMSMWRYIQHQKM
jgi:hypothetical protein